jgi:hypothetical protein
MSGEENWKKSRKIMSPTPSAKISGERAKQIVDKAAQEANDVLQASQSDPLKKPKQMKPAVKEEVAKIVESGDPSKIVQYIKGNKKDFISGVYMSWFMKEIRSQLEGGPASAPSAAGAAAPKEEKKKAAPSRVPKTSSKVLSNDAAKTGSKKAAASAKVAEKTASAAAEALEAAQAESKIAGGPENRKRQKQHASAADNESASEAEEERPAKKNSTTCTSGSHKDVDTLQSPFRGGEEKDEEKDDDSKTATDAEALNRLQEMTKGDAMDAAASPQH